MGGVGNLGICGSSGCYPEWGALLTLARQGALLEEPLTISKR